MTILDKMEAALRSVRGMCNCQPTGEGFFTCKVCETLREYESLKGQIAVVPVQTSPQAAPVDVQDGGDQFAAVQERLISAGYTDVKLSLKPGATLEQVVKDVADVLEAILDGKAKPFAPFNDSTHATSEARKAALAKFDGLIRNIHRISKLAFIPLHVDFDKDTALVRAALQQPDTSEAVRVLVEAIKEAAKGCSAISLIAPEIKDCREYAEMMKVELDRILSNPAVIAAMKGVDHGN